MPETTESLDWHEGSAKSLVLTVNVFHEVEKVMRRGKILNSFHRAVVTSPSEHITVNRKENAFFPNETLRVSQN